MNRNHRNLSVFIVTGLTSWWISSSAQADRIFLELKSDSVETNLQGNLSKYRTGVQVLENKAFLAWGSEDANSPGGIEIQDVSDAAKPVILSSSVGHGWANAIRVDGQYAYLAAGTVRNGTNDPGWLDIFDISVPTHPVRVGSIETPGRGLALQVAGNLAIVSESVRWTGSNLLGALEIFDVANPAQPVRLSTYNTGASATSIDVIDDHAFLADGLTDLEVLDISNPTLPRRVGGYDTDEFRNYGGYEHGGAAVQIQVADGLVYSAGEDGMHILDVAIPECPVRIGGFNFLPFDYAFHVSGQFMFVSFWHDRDNDFWLHVYDMSDRTNIIEVGRREVPGWPTSIQRVGRRVYVASENFLIFEILDDPAFRRIWSNGERIYLYWNAPAGFRLQTSPTLGEPDWKDVPDLGDWTWAEFSTCAGKGFFRLHKP